MTNKLQTAAVAFLIFISTVAMRRLDEGQNEQTKMGW